MTRWALVPSWAREPDIGFGTFDACAEEIVTKPALRESFIWLHIPTRFAAIVTITVVELTAPERAAFSDLWPLRPTAVSYAVSYLFIVITWSPSRYRGQFVSPPTLRSIWINFVHIFTVSVLPFATEWLARTRLASSTMVFYAMLVVCIHIP